MVGFPSMHKDQKNSLRDWLHGTTFAQKYTKIHKNTPSWSVSSGPNSICTSPLQRCPHPQSLPPKLNTKWSRVGWLSWRFWKSCLSHPRTVGFPCTWKVFAARGDLEKASAVETLTVWHQQEHDCRDPACPRRIMKRTHSIFQGY